MLLTDILLQSARRYAQAPALTMKVGYRTVSWTYHDLAEQAKAVAVWLRKQGVQRGDKVLLMAPNSPHWVAVYWGTLLNGSVIVPLNVQMLPATIERIAHQTEAKVFFKIRRLEVTPQMVSPNAVIEDLESLDDVLRTINPHDFKLEVLHQDDLMQIMYTSGTTGDPKGVMLTHRNVAVVIEELVRVLELKPMAETLLSILPLSHIFEQVIGMILPLCLGEHVVYAHAQSALLSLMRKYRVTKMAAVPEFLHIFMARLEGEFDARGKHQLFERLQKIARRVNRTWFSRLLFYPVIKKFGGRLNAIASGGAPLDPELEAKWEALGIMVMQGYGMTEGAPVITTNTFRERRLGSVGKAMSYVELKISEGGEILVRGENIFKGYYLNPEVTAKSFDGQGFFKTGDMGELDEDGYLFLKGRKKYMILASGGQNVFPEDIENVLNALPGVADSCVYGNEVAPGVTEIVAVCLLKPEADEIDALVEQANRQLASYQQITSWHVWPEFDFPRSATRKVKKEDVKRAIAAGSSAHEQHDGSSTVTPIHKIVAQVTGMPLQRVTDSALLVKDLKLDSLTRVELVARLEEDLNKTVAEQLIDQKTTVADLVTLVQRAQPPAPKRELARWPRSWWARSIRPVLQYGAILLMRPFIKVKIHGRSHLQKLKGPVIFMPNHVSLLDGLLVAQALPFTWRQRMSFAAGEDVLYGEYSLFAKLAELVFNTFPLPRTEGGDIQFGLSNIGQMLDNNYSVVLFPEGKLSPNGNLQDLKDGAGLIAAIMRVPVVPIKLKGVVELVKYDKLIPSKCGTIEVHIGEPLYFSSTTTLQEAKQQIAQALAKL